MKEKIEQKLHQMRTSDKKGMEALAWVLTIVLTIATVAVIWYYVQPAVDTSSGNAADAIVENTNSVLGVDE